MRNKLEPSGVRCRLLGYLDDDDTEECKGYKLLDETNMKIIMTDDVRFDLGITIDLLPHAELYEDETYVDDIFGDPSFEPAEHSDEPPSDRVLRPRTRIKDGIVSSE